MSCPVKPWEGTFSMAENQRPPVLGSSLDTANMNSPAGVIRVPVVVGGQPSMQAPPPPLPSRRTVGFNTQAPNFYHHQMYGNRFGGFHPTGFSPFGGFHRGLQEDYDSGMMQAAEESCQALFGPFESVVRSVNSIAMVMDSTMQAMQFSFRTVLSAADSLSRLKVVLRDLLASIATLRILRTFFNKILKLLGLVRGQPVLKEWSEAFDKAALASAAGGLATQSNGSAWPALGFFALMMAGPYLMFKMFSQTNQQGEIPSNWAPTSENSIGVVALYDFDPLRTGDLRMRRGDRLFLRLPHPPSNGWGVASNGHQSGFVPMNRLKLFEPRAKVASSNMGNMMNSGQPAAQLRQ